MIDESEGLLELVGSGSRVEGVWVMTTTSMSVCVVTTAGAAGGVKDS